MKKLVLGLLVSFLTVQAFADNKYECRNASTGKIAGKVTIEKDHILFSKLLSSNEGWILTRGSDGTLYNADPMVQYGRNFIVGKLEFIPYELSYTTKVFYRLLLSINSEVMDCI